MAGIGFELRKLLDGHSFSGLTRAYVYAGVISSGPWIISIFSIIVLHRLLGTLMDEKELTLFSVTITHAYALGLILVGPLQFLLTRYSADLLSEKRTHEVMASCIAALVITAVVSLGVGIVLFGFFTEENLFYRFTAISLLVYVCCIFITANYLTVLQDYKKVVAAFFIGYVVSGLAAYLSAQRWGFEAALFGFATGHLILLISLLWCLQNELGSRAMASWNFLKEYRRFWDLALCGLFYNLGIWIDKMLFWWHSQNHVQVSGFLHASIEYDISIYLSLLSIVPGITVFFLKLETDFADVYQSFFNKVNRQGSLVEIVRARSDIVQVLKSGFAHLMAVQGVVTLALLIYANQLGGWLGIGAIQVGIFRVTLVGAFLLILFLSVLTILFYFDDRRGALVCTLIFGAGNAVLSFATLLANEAWYGFGFVAAAGAAVLVAAIRVNQRTADLEYYIFMPRRETS